MKKLVVDTCMYSCMAMMMLALTLKAFNKACNAHSFSVYVFFLSRFFVASHKKLGGFKHVYVNVALCLAIFCTADGANIKHERTVFLTFRPILSTIK